MESHLHRYIAVRSFYFLTYFRGKHHLVVSCKDFEDLSPHNCILLDCFFLGKYCQNFENFWSPRFCIYEVLPIWFDGWFQRMEIKMNIHIKSLSPFPFLLQSCCEVPYFLFRLILVFHMKYLTGRKVASRREDLRELVEHFNVSVLLKIL